VRKSSGGGRLGTTWTALRGEGLTPPSACSRTRFASDFLLVEYTVLANACKMMGVECGGQREGREGRGEAPSG
jgi:hypothetical protein